jgi:hypothetical protein
MAILSQFDHDLFVSYASGSQGRNAAYLKTWSVALRGALKEELGTSFPDREPNIFIDVDNDRSSGVDQHAPASGQLQSAVEHSALILFLMSDQYLQSKWCEMERTWWTYLSRHLAAEIGNLEFFAIVLPFNVKKWPAEFRGASGDPPRGISFLKETRPHGWPDPTTQKSPEFNDLVVNLGGVIIERVKAIETVLLRQRKAEEYRKQLEGPGGQAIFVHARARDKAKWDAVCDDLVQAGYGVFPEAPEAELADPGADAGGVERAIVKTLSLCDGMLVVAPDDPKSLGAEMVVSRNRRNLARARAKRPLPSAVIDNGITLPDKARFQASVRNLGFEWIETQPGSLPRKVKSWLQTVARELGP